MERYFNNNEEKKHFVEKVFDSVANRYDIFNDVASLGIHRMWKKKLIQEVELQDGDSYLDVACGSGDIALSVRKKYKDKNINITCLDQNQKMLTIAESNFIDQNLHWGVNFVNSAAEKTPFENDCFSTITISFGIRNFSNMSESLQEMFRILKPGGSLMVLEFSYDIGAPATRFVYEKYLRILPKIGELITGDKVSYEYLVDSIKNFPSAINFAKMIKRSGFSFVDWQSFSLGIVNLHIGRK